jgi:hypothetical protein
MSNTMIRINSAGIKLKRTIRRVSFVIAALLTGIPGYVAAQPVPINIGCRLVGADSIQAGTVATYGLLSCKTVSWQLSSGTVNAQCDSTVTIFFNGTATGSVTITAINGGTTIASKQVVIKSVPPLSGGLISGANQTIAGGSYAHQIQASAATQGMCNGMYSYQWFRSTDSINFTTIAGAVGQLYQPLPSDSTVYYKRQTLCNGLKVNTTNMISVRVIPSGSVGTILPAAQVVNYNGQPGAMTLSVPNIGSTGLTYQWELAPMTGTISWQPIAGASGLSYTPPPSDSALYYRVALVDQAGDSLYSTMALVSVLPPLDAGALAPDSQTVASGAVPGPLTVSGQKGGSGAFSYQWYSSPDGQSWALVPGVATEQYWPGLTTATVYYRVVVQSNGLPATTSNAVINVTSSSPTNQ